MANTREPAKKAETQKKNTAAGPARAKRPPRTVKPAGAPSAREAKPALAPQNTRTEKSARSGRKPRGENTADTGHTARKLRIIPLGGLDEIGKNITVYEYGEDILIVDCGMGFPDDDMYGIDTVIPDITYLKARRDRIRGLLLTHGHEDHIGAIPYLIEELGAPVYATRLTQGLVRLKLEERGLTGAVELVEIKAGDRFRLGCFDIEAIRINHSIADAVSFAIRTPVGTVVHTGDFKVDVTPISGEMIDLTRFGELGRDGVLCLLSDSTNVEKPGWSPSESRVNGGLDQLFKNCTKRIIVTTFASNTDRIQTIIDIAAQHGRHVAITGRSMENILGLATELGYIHVPDGVVMDLNRINKLPPEKVVIISTGSQGENMSALYRMAYSEHRQIDICSTDRIIISASAIPGNEIMISRVIDELFRKGAEVVYDRSTNLHASGHACQEELKMMLALTRPKFFIPVHGEHRHLCTHARIAQEMGVPAENIRILQNGCGVEITRKALRNAEPVPAGRVMVDGYSVGEVGSVVLRDRKHLAEDGMVVVVMTLSGEDGGLISGPDIITRGFVYEKESEYLMEELRRVTVEALSAGRGRRTTDWASIKGRVKNDLSGYLYKTTKRSPMILPVIMEV